MQIIKHKINTIEEIDKNFGAEIDVRDYDGELVLSHDIPNQKSQKLENFLNFFPENKLLAINVKSCGIEKKLSFLLNSKNIDYFAFDFSVPYLLNALEQKIVCALRLSEYEKEIFQGPKWIWLDSFNSIWFDEKYVESLKKMNYMISIVSPELHERTDNIEYTKIQSLVDCDLIDAICTDVPEMWI